jgi:starch synthase (maltosyl-transferring)
VHIAEGRSRVVIEAVEPEIDAGRFAIKRTAGESVQVEADVFADGHDSVACRLLYRREDGAWQEADMAPIGNDRWRGRFTVSGQGLYFYTIEGWVDRFLTWRSDLVKRVRAAQNVSVELLIGAGLIEGAAARASGLDAARLAAWARRIREESAGELDPSLALDEELARLARIYPERRFAARYPRELPVRVDRTRAGFSSWYELFPRSCAPEPGRHGTLRDCAARLPYVAGMGFDVLYLPPIHPIGNTFRKGRNNAPAAAPGDPGSPWAIGGAEGGHKTIHPELGSMEDFDALVAAAGRLGMEVALDLAFQCTPDHPWVKKHPQWFRHRPDGTIQYAENPPKKYQDIYPIDFETDDWRALWEELRSVVVFWAARGVRIFRVDNPHTKAMPFWEWLIAEVKRQYPDVLFLAEAFTRPKVMYYLAKLGFTQSYTYFTWRNTKAELIQYLNELKTTSVREYFRPNFWPNTPDILPEYLQAGGRPAFMTRLVLAATLASNYGIYGPAYELCENQPREPGSEEYLNSEKYEIRHRDLGHPWSLKDFIARVNQVRRDSPALQSGRNLRFHDVNNEMLLCYSRTTDDLSNVIVVLANLDFNYTHTGWVTLDLDALGIDGSRPYQMHDLLGDGRFIWQGPRNYVELNPQVAPAHIFRIRRRLHTERDFDYYL